MGRYSQYLAIYRKLGQTIFRVIDSVLQYFSTTYKLLFVYKYDKNVTFENGRKKLKKEIDLSNRYFDLFFLSIIIKLKMF